MSKILSSLKGRTKNILWWPKVLCSLELPFVFTETINGPKFLLMWSFQTINWGWHMKEDLWQKCLKEIQKYHRYSCGPKVHFKLVLRNKINIYIWSLRPIIICKNSNKLMSPCSKYLPSWSVSKNIYHQVR